MNRAILALASNACILLINIFTGILVARMLGPENRGLLASVVSICLFTAEVTSWSIADVLGRSLAASNDKKFDIIGPFAVIIVTGTAIGLVIILALRMNYFSFLFLPGVEILLTKGLIFIIPFFHLSQLLLGILQGNQLWKKWNLIRISPHFAYLIALLLMFLGITDLDIVTTIAIAFAASHALPVILGLHFAGETSIKINGTSWRELLDTMHSAGNIHIGRLLQMTRQHIDKILIPLTFGAEALGYYIVASTLASPLIAGATTICSVYIPRITDELRGHHIRQRRTTMLELIGIGTVGLILATAYSMFAAPLVTLLFGTSFAGAKEMLPLTIAAAAGYSIAKLVEAYLIALNRTKVIKFIEFIPTISIFIGLASFPEEFQRFQIVLSASAWAAALLYLFYFFAITKTEKI